MPHRIGSGVLLTLCLVGLARIARADDAAAWTTLPVPGCWEEVSGGRFADYDGFAWYRCRVKVPVGWQGRELQLFVEQVDNAHEAYFNGVPVGAAGTLPPNYASGLDSASRYPIPAELVRPGQDHVVAIRVYDNDGRGGFKGAAPAVVGGAEAIIMAGKWEFRTGDDVAWAGQSTETFASFNQAVSADLVGQARGQGGGPVPAAEAVAAFSVPDDLQLDLVAAEPEVRQPVNISFDERGRMWVVQYLQYPYPAGLKILSEDKFLRATYDKVPPPPPNHFVGADKITIHEDTDGDGQFDHHQTFLEGLNIVTSVARGRGGVWVLNPPYLLFYPDRDNDDVPDGAPEVHLSGFGIEDTHSCASCLRFGPDGWLYAAQGSTVSGAVLRPGLDKTPVHSLGQLMWRYHPETRRYEIFAEGGGNAWGLEFDSVGRMFSGHNGGDTRGFHYVQGGYFQKGFGKHGPLSNPYAFGYFPAMKHPSVPRFTHAFVLYDGGTLPDAYQDRLFGVAPLQSHVVLSDMRPDGSTFQTSDLGHPLTTPDTRFRPVDIKVGPDGGVYVADMYESEIAHLRHHEGKIDPDTGRIYRLRAPGAAPLAPFDLSALSSAELVKTLAHPNRWFRETALRLLGDRRDASIIPLLNKLLDENDGPIALQALWALNLSGGFDDVAAERTLAHANPYVRAWTVRLLGDDGEVSPALASRLAQLAATEPHVEVRNQLACTARRLPAEHDLAIVRALAARDEDADDVHLPLLLWWAIEAKADADREAILNMLEDPGLWSRPMVSRHLLARLMRRYAASGARQDLLVCARLLQLAPDADGGRQLVRGFEEAFQGRSLANLPPELAAELAKVEGGSPVLALRQGQPEAVSMALAAIVDPSTDNFQRLQYIQIFGEVKTPASLPALLHIVSGAADDELRVAALGALQLYDDPVVAEHVLALYPGMSVEAQSVAQAVLSSRLAWTLALLEAVDAGRIDKSSIPLDTVRKLTVHRHDRLAELIARHWGTVDGATTEEMQQLIARLQPIVQGGSGSPYEGKKLFTTSCGKCHKLFDQGGQIGPDLTSYKRDDIGNMLANIVNPSAEIRENFGTYLVLTDDGRALTGFLVDKDNQVLVLRNAEGQTVTIEQSSIDEMLPQKKSLMPEGLLKDFSEQQVRDLFAYLRSTQPLNE
jgi:putative heme-binding domain-containing protein